MQAGVEQLFDHCLLSDDSVSQASKLSAGHGEFAGDNSGFVLTGPQQSGDVKGIVFVCFAFSDGPFGLLSGLDGIQDYYGITLPGQKLVQTVPIMPCGLHPYKYGLCPA